MAIGEPGETMTQSDYVAVMAAETVAAYCQHKADCKDCVFYGCTMCKSAVIPPEDWDILNDM